MRVGQTTFGALCQMLPFGRVAIFGPVAISISKQPCWVCHLSNMSTIACNCTEGRGSYQKNRFISFWHWPWLSYSTSFFDIGSWIHVILMGWMTQLTPNAKMAASITPLTIAYLVFSLAMDIIMILLTLPVPVWPQCNCTQWISVWICVISYHWSRNIVSNSQKWWHLLWLLW